MYTHIYNNMEIYSYVVDMKRLIEELNCGQKFTNELRELIKKHNNIMLAEDLVGKIMTCFSKTLSILHQVSPTPKYSIDSNCNTSSLNDVNQEKCYKKR